MQILFFLLKRKLQDVMQILVNFYNLEFENWFNEKKIHWSHLLKIAILDIFSCSDEYINGGFSFSQGLNGTFPWSKPSIFRLGILFWLCPSTLHNFKFFWWVFDKCDISWPWKGQAIQAINHTLFRNKRFALM